MSEPPPPIVASIAYQSPPPWSRDVEHLRLLALFHYIVGGIIAFFSSCGLIYLILGMAMVVNPAAFKNQSAGPQQQPPEIVGYMFTFIGGGVTLAGWVLGGLAIYSGRCIAKRQKRTFSLVIAGICCLWFPFGTTLGVFTFIVLMRPSVLTMYQGFSPEAY